ncbi:MBL fold metallo-hydrolase [Aquibacillus halophilus]|uniref:MBL fold metallo-hydrolase n=1 Tax=Aquibacillus halophilus TaxID=930132 RepID=A0A6A8DL94_9BACI|nr:MBL fold metallo-hydrolase [Aquibacillus halophilus]MRH44529.1 MBL fold metallo-hydrolase [Aquibacillus halophilus]
MPKPTDLGRSISLIELYDLGMEKRTGSYILHENELAIIETSASPSIPYLLKGLDVLKIDLKEIKYIIVTHIHLDHAGGVGLLLEKCPNAKVIVHPKGKRHLANPTKLIQGARAVYGNSFDKLFDPILAVPENRLISKEDGETITIGENRTLTFFDTPGHAKHHFSIYDSYSNGIFTGDTIGVFYPQTKDYGFEFVLPSTSPNQFNPDAMLKSLDRIEQLGVDIIYFGHFGKSENPESIYEQIRYWLPKFVDAGEKVIEEYPDAQVEKKIAVITERLLLVVSTFLSDKGIEASNEVYKHIKLDMQICSMGIVDYLEKQK